MGREEKKEGKVDVSLVIVSPVKEEEDENTPTTPTLSSPTIPYHHTHTPQISDNIMQTFAVAKAAGAWRRKAKNRALNQAFSDLPIEVDDSCQSISYLKTRNIPLKNFKDEVRALKDVSNFVEKPIVVFNPESTSWSGIAQELIAAVQRAYPGCKISKNALLRSIVDEDGDSVIPERLQGITASNDTPQTNQRFVTVLSSSGAIPGTVVVFCVLKSNTNLGPGMQKVRIVCLVISPTKEKQTKSAVEVGRTYCTLLGSMQTMHALQDASTPEDFLRIVREECDRVHKEHTEKAEQAPRKVTMAAKAASLGNMQQQQQQSKASKLVKKLKLIWPPGKHLVQDIRRRSKHYLSDFTDGLNKWSSIQKMISSTLFLYFSLLLPALALGVLNDDNTYGAIDARKMILAQGLGGLIFSVFGGQPLGIVLTPIPLVLFTKVIYTFAEEFEVDFLTFYFMTGVFNCCFLALYSLFGVSKIMVYCSRSTEEIVGVFISIAFIVDSMKYVAKEFGYYCFPYDGVKCDVGVPLASFILIFGTLFVGLRIYNFRHSPFLSAGKREIVAEYALAVSVILMSFIGSYGFSSINLDVFEDNADNKTPFYFSSFKFSASSYLYHGETKETKAFTAGVYLVCLALGFIVSILFFVEGNVAQSMVNNPHNRLKKGHAYHLDLMVVAVMNIIMSVFGLPWMHPSLPHSPLHVKALAATEETNVNGVVKEVIVSVTETRLTSLLASILIFVSVLMVPLPLQYIPTAVLYGLLLFLAFSSLDEFQLWERLLLLMTEQQQYPPHHYVRKVPQKVIHLFTCLQLLQLAVLCGLSFSGVSYLKMLFPFVIIGLMPIRKLLIPKIISEAHLDVLDGSH